VKRRPRWVGLWGKEGPLLRLRQPSSKVRGGHNELKENIKNGWSTPKVGNSQQGGGGKTKASIDSP